MRWLRRRYGAHPLHLLLMLATFAIGGYALTRMRDQGGLPRIVVWFAAALLLHDFVGWPIYTGVDRLLGRLSRSRGRDRAPKVAWINHVRVPAVVSGVLLLVSFPLVARLSAVSYRNASGVSESSYLGHWLLVTGTLFAVSAVIYGIRLWRAAHRAAAPPEQR